MVGLLVVGALGTACSTEDGSPGAAPTTPAPSSSAADRSTTTTAATTTTTAPTTTTTAVPGPELLTMAFAGDLLPHGPLNAVAASYGAASGSAYDYAPMLAPMRPILEGVDVAVCHLEVPMSPDGVITSYPSFGSPGELIDAVAVSGYDGCSTASNHSLDRGFAGIVATLDRMDARKLRHVGTARTEAEGAQAAVYDVDGAQVAHLSYAYDFNGYRIPADAPFAVDQIDVDRIRLDAALARQGGADLVVVSLHWGTEYRHEPSAYQRDVATRLLPNPDIDLVVGHHAHVVQPIEKVGGTFVVWGLGNQLANQAQPGRSDGLTVQVAAVKGDDGRYEVAAIEAIPTLVDAGGSFEVWPIVASLRDPTIPPERRQRLIESYDRTAAVLATVPTEGVTLAPRP